MAAATIVPPSMMLGPDGLDPRNNLTEDEENVQMKPNAFLNYDINSLPLDVYMYHARMEREREDNDTRAIGDSVWTRLFYRVIGKMGKKNHDGAIDDGRTSGDLAPPLTDSEKQYGQDDKKDSKFGGSSAVIVTEDERFHAYRALRSASWQGVFFLITTDILGPSSAPYAFMETGWVGGTLTYLFFYILAFLGGQILWRMYMDMDSREFPVKCYADLGERMFGRTVRHIFNILQSLQLVLNVGIITIGNAQTLASVIDYKLCYSILCVLFTIAGMAGGQIQSLKSFSFFANGNVWLNVVVIILTMVGVGVYLPVPAQNGYTTLAPIVTAALPANQGWFVNVQGVQLAVFAYGGAMIFVEFMAEMQRPRDFWKAAFIAQTFIFLMYMLFGMFIYGYQGQFTPIIPSLGFDNRALSLVTNIIGLITGTVAAVLYGNIGAKIIYYNVFQPYFRAPELTSKKGRMWWVIIVLVYWALAFIIASAIPNLSSMLTIVGAACILQFTYTFPPILYAGFIMQKDAMVADTPWQPGMEPYSNRIDTWRQASRWKRGFAKQWYFKALLITIFLASLSLCGLGCYAGVEQLIAAFGESKATSFGCRAPGQPLTDPTPP